MKPPSEARRRTLALQERALKFTLRLAKLDASEQLAALEDEAGQLCAIFATIAIKVANRMQREGKPPRSKR